jgi:hypothetical protein
VQVVQYVEAVTLANAALAHAEAITRKQERDALVLLEMVTRIAKECGDPVHNGGGLNIQPLLPRDGDEADPVAGFDTEDEDESDLEEYEEDETEEGEDAPEGEDEGMSEEGEEAHDDADEEQGSGEGV